MELKRGVVTPSDHRPAYLWRHCAAFVAVISLFSWWLIHPQPVDTNYTGRITRRYWWDHPLCYETSSSPGWMSQLLPPCRVSYYMHKPYSKFFFFISCGLVPSSFWDRRYSWWSYSSMLPCLLCCPISALPLSYLSYTHLSTLCLASFFFSLECPHLALFSLCATHSFSLHGRTTSVLYLKFSWTLAPLLCPSNVVITDRIPLWHSAHPSQYPHWIFF